MSDTTTTAGFTWIENDAELEAYCGENRIEYGTVCPPKSYPLHTMIIPARHIGDGDMLIYLYPADVLAMAAQVATAVDQAGLVEELRRQVDAAGGVEAWATAHNAQIVWVEWLMTDDPWAFKPSTLAWISEALGYRKCAAAWQKPESEQE